MKRQFIFIIGALLIAGCKPSTPSRRSQQIEPINEVNIKKSVISIPKNLRQIESSFVHTSYIGTSNHPTIDGGIVNSADGLAVNHDQPNIAKPILITPNEAAKKPFDDEWATSDKVKRLLVSAGNQGKLDYVLKKTDQMQLPASVAIVPMVESNYDRKAVSPKGAGGAWQLMPSTAKEYGLLEQDRFQLTKSTDTALKLLNDLHQEFGNWELAFAAYNAGSKRVQNAIQKNPRAKSINELELPMETKIYVNRIMSINKKIGEFSSDV